jgi:hypothetical protein
VNLVKFSVGDVVEMKKNHPCGGNLMTVLYAASDIKLRCNKCGHEISVERIKIEKRIRKVIESHSPMQ